MKEIEDNVDRWKDTLCPWTGRINIVKMIILPKAIYRFNAIHIKIPMAFFHRSGRNHSKICIESQKTLNSQTILRKKNKAEGIILPDFKLYYKAWVIKTVLSGTKTHTEINGTEQRAQKWTHTYIHN